MNFWDCFYQECTRNNTKPNPLAKGLGISSGVVTKWKNGSIPNGEQLIKIADALGVSVDYLLGRDEKDSPDENVKDILIERVQTMSDHQADRLLGFLDAMADSDK